MALPWLIGAAVVGIGAALSFDDSSKSSNDDDDDYDKNYEDARRREKIRKEEKLERVKSDFFTKWEVGYRSDFETTEKYIEIQREIIILDDEITVLEELLQETKRI